jgi:hypothetical protein
VLYSTPLYAYPTGAPDAMPYVGVLQSDGGPPAREVVPPSVSPELRTYPYDGGPRSPVPRPKVQPDPRKAPVDRPVVLPEQSAKYRYRAYGERPEPEPPRSPGLITAKREAGK